MPQLYWKARFIHIDCSYTSVIDLSIAWFIWLDGLYIVVVVISKSPFVCPDNLYIYCYSYLVLSVECSAVVRGYYRNTSYSDIKFLTVAITRTKFSFLRFGTLYFSQRLDYMRFGFSHKKYCAAIFNFSRGCINYPIVKKPSFIRAFSE